MGVIRGQLNLIPVAISFLFEKKKIDDFCEIYLIVIPQLY